MLSFVNDYSEGAHPNLIRRLTETNEEVLCGYGEDKYCASAAKKIKAACGKKNAEVYFISGGTQTNMVVIDAMTAKYQGVIAASTGHINCHEAGAVEFTGHKVIGIPHKNGKLEAGDLSAYLKKFYGDEAHEHMSLPGLVYISHPTEYGTLYTKSELTAIYGICREYKIPLYIDGARLGYGLMTPGTDLTLNDIASLCDVFYIGGTKVGALCGEAVVFTHKNMPPHFVTSVKQHGAMLAKGRLCGVQFDELFTNNLYFEISKNAIDTAIMLKKGFAEKGYEFFIDSPTNQTFVLLENKKMEELKKKVNFCFWETTDENHTVVRFCTSWATKAEDVKKLIELI